MGLDITAYAKPEPAPEPPEGVQPSEWHDDHEHHFLYANPDFPGREAPQKEGYYLSRPGLARARRSYGGHRQWRERLMQLFYGVENWDAFFDGDNPKFTEGPFFELICFSDCEGTMGTDACRKLAEDFKTHREAYVSAFPGDTDGYDSWAECFRVAAEHDGYVSFH